MPGDSEMIKRFQEGDRRAFEALVSRYQRPLFTFLLRLTGNRERAEDLFQETFIRVLQALPGYKEQGKFGSWLFSIANRVSVDAWRRDRAWKDRVVADEQALDQAVDLDAPVDEILERTELLEKVQAALLTLPEKQRRVFLLRQHGELRFVDIAVCTGEPLNTVLSHMRYAVAKLRKVLQPFIENMESSESCEKGR